MISLSPLAPEDLVSRDRFDHPVTRQPAHSLHRLNLVLTHRIPLAFRDIVYIVDKQSAMFDSVEQFPKRVVEETGVGIITYRYRSSLGTKV